MGYVNCESAKDLVRMCLFEKKLSLFKEVAIFSISFLYQFQNKALVVL